MKQIVLIGVLLGLAANVNAQVKLSNATDSASYALGLLLVKSIQSQIKPGMNTDMVAKAIESGLKGQPTAFPVENAKDIFVSFIAKEDMDFLAKNKKRPTVKTTASGLQYEVIKSGDPAAPMPKATDMVRVHYHGTLINGQVFDSSVERNSPAEFALNRVIAGWTEGLQLMRVGDKFKFFIPYNLAYGERGQGAKIKPYATLVFEVELLDIVGPK